MIIYVLATFIATVKSSSFKLNLITDNSSAKWHAYCHFEGDLLIEVLTCGKCYYSTNNVLSSKSSSGRFCSYFSSSLNQTAQFTSNYSLLSSLEHDWFHKNLLQLINNKQIATNLVNSTNKSFNKISDTLKIIDLTDFGIESISQNAFKRFINLRSLKLSNNNLSTIELSSFSFDIDYYLNSTLSRNENFSITTINNSNNKSQLIELDLSMNRIGNVKIENFMYLNNLKVLNLSQNELKNFDLKFISIISPKLQVLDLSYNHLKQFKILDDQDRYYLANESENLINNKKVVSFPNTILDDLIYLNLYGNMLTDFAQLFSIDMDSLEDNSYCLNEQDMSSSKNYYKRQLKYKLNINKNQPININIKNNTWSCDCKTYELLFSIINLQSKLDNIFSSSNNNDHLSQSLIKYTKTCYLDLFVNENNFIFNNLMFYLNIYNIFDLNCYSNMTTNDNKTMKNWFMWYNLKCINKTIQEEAIPNENYTDFDDMKSTIPIQTTTTTTKLITKPINYIQLQSSSIFPFNLFPAFTTTTTSSNNFFSKFKNDNNIINFTRGTTITPARYDVSTAFYWVSSVCIAIIALSCIFVGWFYCLKRYRISRRIMRHLNYHANHNNNNSNRRRNQTPNRTSTNNNRVQPATSRNVFYLNGDPMNLYHHTNSLRNYTPAINRHSNHNNQNLNNYDNLRHNGEDHTAHLYYISATNGGIYFESNSNRNNNNNLDSSSINDDPPNYYEAILGKNSLHKSNSLAKNSNLNDAASTSNNLNTNEDQESSPSPNSVNLNSNENQVNESSTDDALQNSNIDNQIPSDDNHNSNNINTMANSANLDLKYNPIRVLKKKKSTRFNLNLSYINSESASSSSNNDENQTNSNSDNNENVSSSTGQTSDV